MTVTEVKGGNDLPEEPPGLLGGETALLDQVVEELAPGDVFKHQVSEEERQAFSSEGKRGQFVISRCMCGSFPPN